MNRIILLLFVLVLLQVSNYSQNGWSWVSTPVDSTRRHMYDVHFFSADTGWFMGQGQDGIYTRAMFGYTTDGGNTWDTTIFGFPADYTVEFWDELLSLKFYGAILRTEDGWETWTKPFVDTIGLAGVGKFASANYVYAGGLNTIIKSTDSGISWAYIQPIGLEFGRISDISVIDTNIVYAISGENLLKTEDGGLNWQEIVLPDLSVRYWQVKFLTENYGWITGEFRTIYLTTDGGKSWINQSPPVDYDAFRQFYALNESIAAASSSAGAIFWTTNGGVTWVEQLPKEIYSLGLDIQIVNDSVAYAVGWYGTMLKTTTGGITWIEEENDSEITADYELEQNYPNPFNPATIIIYSLQKEGLVTLKVYNTLGEEVKTLVNEIKPTGKYEAEFNVSELPSGVYIYRMKSGDFVSSKKMVLLK